MRKKKIPKAVDPRENLVSTSLQRGKRGYQRKKGKKKGGKGRGCDKITADQKKKKFGKKVVTQGWTKNP